MERGSRSYPWFGVHRKTRRITISSPFAAHGPNVEPVDRHPSREAGVMKYYERWQRSWPQHKTLYFACNAPPHLDVHVPAPQTAAGAVHFFREARASQCRRRW